MGILADAGYRGRGKDGAKEVLGVEVEIVNRSPKPPEEILRIWAREYLKDRPEMDLKKLPERPTFERLPRRQVAEHDFAWLSRNRRMKNYKRMGSTGEALVYASMMKPMVRGLTRGQDSHTFQHHVSLWSPEAPPGPSAPAEELRRRRTHDARLANLWTKDVRHQARSYPDLVGGPDVYHAVLEHGARTPEQFVSWLRRGGLPGG